MTPAVSIVMAAKNYARFLPAAVESVRAQTFADWELVIIDDGSTDDAPAAVQPFLVDKRIRYVRSDRLGQSRAKNLGIDLSRAPLVAFLDADDLWQPTKLAKQVAMFTADANVGVVYCLRELIDEAGGRIPAPSPLCGGGLGWGCATTIVQAIRSMWVKSHPPTPTLPHKGGRGQELPRGHVLDDIFVRNFVCFSSVVVRREVFARVGGFDPACDLSIDYDLWLRVAPHYAFDYVPEELVLYRTGHGNLSQKLTDRIATAFSRMHQTVHRRQAPLSADAVAEGYASTCRSLAWVYRGSEPVNALKWYARSLRWPRGRLASLKGLLGALRDAAGNRHRAAAAVNRSVNA